MSDISYKKRTIILSHDGNDCHHHVTELKRWHKLLVKNARMNHRQDLWEEEMNFNLETNPKRLWRPWHRLENSEDALQSATDEEYKIILKEMLFGDSEEKKKEKKIILTKNKTENKEEETPRKWVKLTHPDDEIRLEKMSKKKIKDRRRNGLMKIGEIQDMFHQEDKEEDKIEGRKKRSNRRQKTRSVIIRSLHNLVFKKDEHFGL